mgnify:FL=1
MKREIITAEEAYKLTEKKRGEVPVKKTYRKVEAWRKLLDAGLDVPYSAFDRVVTDNLFGRERRPFGWAVEAGLVSERREQIWSRTTYSELFVDEAVLTDDGLDFVVTSITG